MFQGKLVQKPDFTAPGVNILSSIPGGGYEEMSGTSMACPHASGVSALLFQVNPNFTPQNVREILLKTLRYVDANGNPIQQPVWDAAYGFGRMDAYAAVKAALGSARSLFTAGFNSMQLGSLAMMNSKWIDMEESRSDMSDLTTPYATNEANWTVVR